MSLENGKCPSCGGALLLDSSKEKTVCKFCGHEVVIQQAVQKCIVDGIADFDTLLLTAQQAVDFDNDYDKAMEKYKEALNLRPQDYRCYWGLYISEIEGIKFARDYHGFVQMPGDIPQKVEETIQRYGKCAYQFAPENIKPYYYRVMQNDRNTITNPVEEKKKGCYIATAVYGSYDCPQVWVLRRYRDQNLSAHFCGKIFIKTYYFLSPKIVKLFGKTKWFNKFWRKYLDKKIERLKINGYADTPYNDKY